MEDDEYATSKMGGIKIEDGGANGAHAGPGDASAHSTPGLRDEETESPAPLREEQKSRSESVGTPNSQKPPRLSRKSSQKNNQPPRTPTLYDHLPDVTEQSCSTFQVIPDCLYGSKHLGATDNDALDCDCKEVWRDGENFACGEDSDCINRATKMECNASAGNCGGGCQNQRFQRREYASVSVIRTEKKGFGLRTDSDLQANDFVYEYIGEVINEPTFRRRMLQYDQEGIKHFYFMSLNKSEFVDATKKGNLGRFCNHSCSPNCYVDKWVVGDKLRMGIFALRNIYAGEELVFNYNVDRYGADPAPCYCGEPNCVGFIGGKTQTERSTKLPTATVEALGIDDGDSWDTAVAKKPRKKRVDEEDEDYVNSIQPRGLDEDDARKVMAALMQCKEKWIAIKLLARIERCDEERVLHCVMRMHAYQILKTVLNNFSDDYNVVKQVLEILDKFPRLTRNKIQDSKIEAAIEPLTQSEDESVAFKSQKLLSDWSKLSMAYRIQRRKGGATAPAISSFQDRRGYEREEEAAPVKPASPLTIDAPKGPRGTQPQRNNQAFFASRQRQRPNQTPLPQGWFAAKDGVGRTYFYDKQNQTTWERPTKPAAEPTVNKAAQEQLAIQAIINKVTREGSTPKQPQVRTPQAAEAVPITPKLERWRNLPAEKQMKIYENTIFPPIKYMLDKFRHKLPKDELKRFGKELPKKLASSDFKHNRVADPTAELDDKQVQKIKKYVKDFLDRAVVKYDGHKGRKAAQSVRQPSQEATPRSESAVNNNGLVEGTPAESSSLHNDGPAEASRDDMSISDGDNARTPSSPGLKRKRGETEVGGSTGVTTPDSRGLKRLKDGVMEGFETPPPPPPLLLGNIGAIMTPEKQALREQEEALMRENEEAQRLEDEANTTTTLEDAVDNLQKERAEAARSSQSRELLGH